MKRGWLVGVCGLLGACNAVEGLSLGKDTAQHIEVLEDAASTYAVDAGEPLASDAAATPPVQDATLPVLEAGPAQDADAPVIDAATDAGGATDSGTTPYDAGKPVNPLCKVEPWHCTGGGTGI